MERTSGDKHTDYPAAMLAARFSIAQEAVWSNLAHLANRCSCSAGWVCPVTRPCDPSDLRAVLQRLVDAHDVLRMVLVQAGGVVDNIPVPHILAAAEAPLRIVDLSGHADSAQRAARYIEEAKSAPFALDGSLLWELLLVRSGPQDGTWVCRCHPLVCDSAALRLLHRAIVDAGQVLAPAAHPLLDQSRADDAYLASAACARDQAFWQERFPVPPAPLFAPHARAPDNSAANTVSWHIVPALRARLEATASEHACTLTDVLLTALATWFDRMQAAGGTVVIGLERQHQRALGRFSTVVPVTIRLRDDDTFAHNMRRVADEVGLCVAHERYPLSRLAWRADAAQRLADVVLCVDDAASEAGGDGPAFFGHGLEHAALAVLVHGDAAHTRLDFHWNRQVLAYPYVAALQRALAVVIEAVAAGAPSALSALPLLGAAERRRVLAGFNATARHYPQDVCVHQLVERQAQSAPDAIAIESGAGALSYGALNARANQLAHHLRTVGVAPDATVALYLERGADMVIAMLAVLKAGGAYVPLDPAYPPVRVAWMLADSGAAVLLTQSRLVDGIEPAAGMTVLALDSPLPPWQQQPCGDLSRAMNGLASSHLAYVIYTSGSTGQPKGVMVEHRNLVNLIGWHCETFPLAPGERASSTAGIAFDACTWEVWPPLCMGAVLALAPADAAGDPVALLDWWNQQDLHTSFLVTALADIAMKRDARAARPLRTLLVGGDRLARAPAADVDFELVNNYGPTETTVVATSGRILPGDAVIHIGRPIANTSIYLLDRHGQPVPVGVAGEMYIGGAGVARGYLNQPRLTGERFLADPFAGAPDARMYRTGDLARWLDDGTIEFLGRNDQQVKIRGLRIELGEIEAQLACQPGVREAVVLAREDIPGDPRLVAYITGTADARAVRAALSLSLPAYMVPAACVPLDALPLTPNGKIDRKLLPAPGASAFAQRPYAAPQGPLEQALAAIWADLLQCGPVGRDDHFFELGGHSLLAVELMERMRGASLAADIRTLFAQPTIAALALAVEHGEPCRADAPVAPNAIPTGCASITPAMLPLIELDALQIDRIAAVVPGGAANIQDIYPLAPLQEGILFHHLMQTEGDPYLLLAAWSFDSRQRMDGFVQALQQVIDRHDALRTAVVWEGLKEPVQVVWRSAPLDVQVLTFAHGEAAAGLAEHTDPRRLRLDLRQAPLMRAFAAFDADRQCWLLQLLLHHMVVDHATLALLLREVATIQAGGAQSLPPPVPFRDFIARSRQTGRAAAHEAFYRDMLGDVDEPTTPFGLADVRGDGSTIREAERMLGASLSQRLRRQARALGVSPASLFHAAWAQVLARGTGRDDIVFGTVLYGRMQGGADAGRAMGLFVNTLPLRIRLGDTSVVESVRDTHAALARLVMHEDASLALAQRCSALPNGTPLFSSLLNYRHGVGLDTVRWGEGIAMEPVQELSNYPFSLRVDDLEHDFRLSTLIALPVPADRICDYMHTALEQIAEALEHAPQTPASRIDVMNAAQRHEVLRTWNDTRREVGASFVHELLELRAAQSPAAIALEADGETLSYRDLNERANRLAHHLLRLGVRPDTRVALALERGVALVVGMLATLKAGGAYVPLDPHYPSERLAFMLDDCRPKVVLTQASVQERLPACRALMTATVLELDAAFVPWADADAANPGRAANGLASTHLAYVIYTSGSTGKPKGVMVEHRNVANLVGWHTDSFPLAAGERASSSAGIAFDACTWEVWPPLCMGAVLTLAPADAAGDPVALLDWWERQDLHNSFLVTALADVALRRERKGNERLRTLLIGGDRLLKAPAADLPFEVVNNYGPTESTVVATSGRLVPGDPVIHIGRPIANTSIYLLDRHGRPVPPGVAGEMYVGGASVARGYLNQPQLTEERFLADPFAGTPDARMYRTGDMARWLDGGTIEFLGRNDHQVKIRGLRIELGEIETHISRHDGVREAVVLAREDSPGEQRLVAYLVGDVDPQAVRDALARQLPIYMVPAAYVLLVAMPLTPNGKLDRKALPAPEGSAYAQRAYEAPQGATETALAAIWAELLQLDRVGRHDHFFELGGHSLLAVQLMERMRRQDLAADIRTLFSQPTLAALARAVDAAGHGSVIAAVPANAIPAGCTAITPAMLPLVKLDAGQVERIARTVPGGMANIQDIYPVAPLQEGILFHHLLQTEGDPYLSSATMAFDSRARMDGFVAALEQVIERHDVLRTAVLWEGLDEPVQVVWRHARFTVDTPALGPGDTAAQLRAVADPLHFRLDVRQAPLLHGFAAFDEASQSWMLQLLMHHMILDHTTLDIMFQEMGLIQAGRADALSEPVPFRDFVAEARREGRARDHEAFFRKMLGDVDEPTAPFGLTDIKGDGGNIEEVRAQLPPALAQRLRRQARAAGVSAASLFHWAWAQVLAKITGRDEAVFGTVLFGRMQGGAGADRAMGLFINTLPLRVMLGEVSVHDGVRQTHALLAGLMEHEHAPLALAQRCSALPNSVPLFTALLNYRHSANERIDRNDDSGWRSGIEMLSAHERTNYPFGLSVDDLGENFDLSVQIARPVDAARICRYLQRALEGMVDALEQAPQTPAWRIAIADREERRQEHGQITLAPAQEHCIDHLFERQAARTPQSVAVTYEDHCLTYAALNEQANRLAHHLRTLGAGPEQRIAICMERGLDMVVAILAVLKAGAAYVPMDPAYPAERLAYMLRDSAPLLMLTQAGGAAPAPDGVSVLAIDGDAQPWQSLSPLNPEHTGATTRSLAYVIYTSGSTGQPKGVMVEHGNVARLFSATQPWFGFGPSDVWTLFHSFAFDFSVWELWGALLHGGHLVVVPYLTTRNPQAFYALLCERGVTVLNQTPSAFLQVMDQQGAQPHRLRHVIFGGEALEVGSLARWFARSDAAATQLVNMYDITETTVHVTYRPIVAADLAGRREASPIGHAIPDLQLYLLDAHGEPVIAGVPGEIHVGGAGVARGYLNRPDLTAQRFVPDPFGGGPGARLYKTGDMGCRLPDGAMEFLGRNDQQVKIRGFRIELGEIEAQLGRLPGVREAVVLARDDGRGDKRLVAYVVATGVGFDAGALHHALAGVLPEHMVPAAYVPLASLPLTPNGKLDRKALPAPQGAAFAHSEYAAPQGPVEGALAELWSELLQVERVGRNDHFFDLGGHSLLAVQMTSRLRQRLGLEVPLAALFAKPVLRSFAMLVSASAASTLPAIVAGQRPAVAPLSFAQQRLWFISQMSERAAAAYHMLRGLRLRGALDTAALQAALDAIIRRHEVLRTRVGMVDGHPVQDIAPAAAFALVCHDLREAGESGDEAIARWSRHEAQAPFDLAHGSPIRGRLLRLGEHDHCLLLTMHHMAADGWSMGVLAAELRALYCGDELPALSLQYADYALWQRQWLDGAVQRIQLAYWQQQLAGAPGLITLPTDRPRPTVQDYAGQSVPVRIERELASALKALSQKHGTTLFMTLLAAWGALSARLAGQDEVVIGSPVANRGRVELEPLIGFFANTLALRLDLSGGPSVGALLAQARECVLEGQSHQDVPFEQVVEALKPQRTLSHSPIFQLMFAWQNTPQAAASLDGVDTEEIILEHPSATVDLSLDLEECDGAIVGWMTFASALFDRATIERHLGCFSLLLAGMANDDTCAIDRIDILSDTERAQVLRGWNRTRRDYRQDLCIHEIIEEQAQATPHAVAVELDESRLTYRELNEQANQLAHYLSTHGAGPEQRVALCLERSLEMVVAILAVLKAGAAYVPLDPAYPAARLAFMLADSAPCVLLTQAGIDLPAEVPTVLLDCAERPWQSMPTTDLAPAQLGPTPAHLAYVIYTSGSTGQPKGVMNEHAAVVNRLLWMQDAYRIDAADAVLQKTPFSFDVSVWEFFWPLMQGARLVMARPGGHKDPAYLADTIRRHAITTAHFVPSMLQAFVDSGAAEGCAQLRRVMCSGEALPGALARRFVQCLPRTELHNLYGPTEAAVDVTAWHCKGSDLPDIIPIGRPIANTTIYLLDRHGKPVPAGVAGEIHIGGVQVARGYLNRDELTAQRFVADPFAGKPGARMYKTGDLGRWLADGTVEFLGRTDHQVKIRGQRIELGEIEAHLARQDGVREVVVLAREDSPGDQRLVAYVVGAADPQALRAALARELPDYMVPAACVVLDALPLSANGKLDRKALPAPEGAAFAQRAYAAPKGETEAALARIWVDLLRLERVGRHDHFFELGGHSLLVMQLIARIRQTWDVDVPLMDVFANPTLCALASVILDYELLAFDADELEFVISQHKA
ncbi:non-ribosomal peptide synthetase [Massilia violaceinigra]|uniref:Non-ribosomal peptide synthetase n=1 Tax=Massilia violaceinigra TaxID=2045208 RepID=A0A2D2DQV0_9BURK|nr:non-ribosomal peptide synthetase [Massilia violaceinigra]ATQ77349.1 non-ribosomal peptide synthetase [Massilia violaceinigra]